MAQVIDYYQGVVSGGSTIYYYKNSSGTTGATRIYNGTYISIYADASGNPQLENSRYHIFSPGGGWLDYYYAGSKTAVYKTVTDKLAAPSADLSRATAKMTVSGGTDGDLNTLSAYGYQYREKLRTDTSWGDSWSDEATVAASSGDSTKQITVSVSDELHERQYRVRAHGSAGSDYYSDWAVCPTLMFIEDTTVIGACSLAAPTGSAVTHVGNGSVLAVVSREASDGATGDLVKMQYSYDGSSWVTLSGTLSAEGGTSAVRVPVTGEGSKTLYLRQVDSSDETETGTACTLSFGQSTRVYSRSIATGSVISSSSISHKGEIEQMLELVNTIASGAGRSSLTFSKTCGYFSNWKSNMEELRDKLVEMRTAYSAPAGTFTVTPPETVASYPAASVVNTLRNMIDEF